MPSWGTVLDNLKNTPNPMDAMRRKYLGTMHKYTGRNIIAYYSAFVQKPRIDGTGIDDNDKNAFMQAVCGLDRSKGLDLILHTPGGQIAAAESLVSYLKALFGKDIRVFVPQIAMSAGTMIALSSKEIIMGKQSNLGPIDPQFGGMSCAGIIEEFNEACSDCLLYTSGRRCGRRRHHLRERDPRRGGSAFQRGGPRCGHRSFQIGRAHV